jgi:uncharacterized membrane-anchored protein
LFVCGIAILVATALALILPEMLFSYTYDHYAHLIGLPNANGQDPVVWQAILVFTGEAHIAYAVNYVLYWLPPLAVALSALCFYIGYRFRSPP